MLKSWTTMNSCVPWKLSLQCSKVQFRTSHATKKEVIPKGHRGDTKDHLRTGILFLSQTLSSVIPGRKFL